MEHRRISLGRNLFQLGLRLGALGAVAIGSAGGSLALALARAAGCGAALAGGEVRFHDGRCAACAAWLVQYYHLPASLFLHHTGGDVTCWVLDHLGRLFDPPAFRQPCSPCTGTWDLLVGVDQAWAADRCAGVRRSGSVCALGPDGLTLALERMGYIIVPPRPGVPTLRSDQEGFSLTLEWNGSTRSLPGTDALEAAASWRFDREQIPAFRPNTQLL